MTGSAVFGSVVTDTDIEDLVIAKLRAWLPAYLAEMERRTGRTTPISLPKSWGIPQARFEKWPEEWTPHVEVNSAGTDNYRRDGEGDYSCTYGIEVTCVVSAPTPAAVESLAKHYITAIELILVQQPVGDPVEQLLPLGHRPEDLSDKKRSMMAMTAVFSAQVSGVMNRFAGLKGEPPEDPSASPEDNPLVESVELDVEPLAEEPLS
jgi:hypothetical protein